jgi:hypothetical protein
MCQRMWRLQRENLKVRICYVVVDFVIADFDFFFGL